MVNDDWLRGGAGHPFLFVVAPKVPVGYSGWAFIMRLHQDYIRSNICMSIVLHPVFPCAMVFKVILINTR